MHSSSIARQVSHLWRQIFKRSRSNNPRSLENDFLRQPSNVQRQDDTSQTRQDRSEASSNSFFSCHSSKPRVSVTAVDQAQDSTLSDPRHNIADMPLDVIFEVLDNLSPLDKLVLSRTCSSFYHIVLRAPAYDHFRLSERHKPGQPLRLLMSDDEQLEYLCRVTRDRLDSWACNVCIAVHTLDFNDTPAKRERHPCDKTSTPYTGPQPATAYPPCIALPVRHYHVQMVLKYLKQWDIIGSERQQYVRDVLSPYCHSWPNIEVEDKWSGEYSITGQLWMLPKVVSKYCSISNTYERRFLLKTMRMMENCPCPSFIKYFRPCPHCIFNSPGAHGRRYVELPVGITQQPLYDMLHRAFLLLDGIRRHGACIKCSTDVSAHFSKSGKAVVSTWHDLGGESSPLDPAWRAQHETHWQDPHQHSSRPSCVWYYHEPGSVIKMYEENEWEAMGAPPSCMERILRSWDTPFGLSTTQTILSDRGDKGLLRGHQEIEEVGYPEEDASSLGGCEHVLGARLNRPRDDVVMRNALMLLSVSLL